jgi:dimethylhistidine N-methyltransferase
MDAEQTLTVDDQTPEHAEALCELVRGLSQPEKWISSIYFYDDHGAVLFDRITELPEYYLTRIETSIMREHGADMARAIGPNALVIEPGSGAGEKIRLLLGALDNPVAYVPIEIAREHLRNSSETLARDFPELEVLPVWADFTRSLDIPKPTKEARRSIVYFPGSTLGNFEPDDAVSLLRNFAAMVGKGGAALIGVDLAKEAALIEPAYNDSEGVTAAFNLNMLAHLNRRFGADFNPENFVHEAFYNPGEGRVEMHLKSLCDQDVHLGGETIHIARNESIHTESSYKYSDERFAALAEQGGFRMVKSWKDPERMFSVRYLERL